MDTGAAGPPAIPTPTCIARVALQQGWGPRCQSNWSREMVWAPGALEQWMRGNGFAMGVKQEVRQRDGQGSLMVGT